MDIEVTGEEKDLLKKVAAVSHELRIEAYVIGGFVRDKIFGRPTKDIDIVCIGDANLFANQLAMKFRQKPTVSHFKNFGTSQIKLGDVEIEFVGARTESYSRNSRKPTVEPGTLQDDQNRRDFTINALAISLNAETYGQLIDPFGGMADLENGIIKTPLEPVTTFSDDPLRMMRAIRFAAQLGFAIEAGTYEAISTSAHRIEIISGERIADELNKIVLSPKPSVGFKMLNDTGLLERFFPQMVALAGAEYIEGKGHKDNFTIPSRSSIILLKTPMTFGCGGLPSCMT